MKMRLQGVEGFWGDWMQFAQDRDRWWALVSTVKKLRVPYNAGNFLTSYEERVASQDSAPWSE
jgi:hypothetical protein